MGKHTAGQRAYSEKGERGRARHLERMSAQWAREDRRMRHGAAAGLAVLAVGTAAFFGVAAHPVYEVATLEGGTVSVRMDEARPCEYEDSNGCVWVASERSNGRGVSFHAAADGTVTALEHSTAAQLAD